MIETRATRLLREAVELCLAEGMSPRVIMAAVGGVFWGITPGGCTGRWTRWPRSRLGGWSDEPRPEPDRIAAKAADVTTILDEIKGS